MRVVVSTMLALMIGGGVSLLAGSAGAAPPRVVADAKPRSVLSTTVGAAADCTIYSGQPTDASRCGNTTPVATPLPVSHKPRALRIKVVLSWTWNGARIRLRKVKVGTMPGDTRLTMSCQGDGCPRHSAAESAGARTVRRALLRLAGRRYRAGDVLSVKLTAAGYRQERARIFFRNGKRPLIRG